MIEYLATGSDEPEMPTKHILKPLEVLAFATINQINNRNSRQITLDDVAAYLPSLIHAHQEEFYLSSLFDPLGVGMIAMDRVASNPAYVEEYTARAKGNILAEIYFMLETERFTLSEGYDPRNPINENSVMVIMPAGRDYLQGRIDLLYATEPEVAQKLAKTMGYIRPKEKEPVV